MKHIDARAILDNRLFNEEYEKAMEVALSNFEGANIDNDRARLEAQITRRTLKTFKEAFERHTKTLT